MLRITGNFTGKVQHGAKNSLREAHLFTRFDMRDFKHIIVPESLQLTFLLFSTFY